MDAAELKEAFKYLMSSNGTLKKKVPSMFTVDKFINDVLGMAPAEEPAP
jgi:hypothetical protein